MSDHIKGPWVMVPRVSGSENHRGYRIADSSNWYFAEVMPIDPDGIEGRARANLIAAAPALLEALMALKAIRSECYIPNAGNWLDDKINAAIAKATEGE